jgi:hypothetical protein
VILLPVPHGTITIKRCYIDSTKLPGNHKTKFLLFTESGFQCDLFRSTWPSSGDTQYIQNTWEDISNIKFYKK